MRQLRLNCDFSSRASLTDDSWGRNQAKENHWPSHKRRAAATRTQSAQRFCSSKRDHRAECSQPSVNIATLAFNTGFQVRMFHVFCGHLPSPILEAQRKVVPFQVPFPYPLSPRPPLWVSALSIQMPAAHSNPLQPGPFLLEKGSKVFKLAFLQ